MSTAPDVHTYADGFGRWHAMVEGARDADHARRIGGRAIRREIVARGLILDPPLPRLSYTVSQEIGGTYLVSET